MERTSKSWRKNAERVKELERGKEEELKHKYRTEKELLLHMKKEGWKYILGTEEEYVRKEGTEWRRMKKKKVESWSTGQWMRKEWDKDEDEEEKEVEETSGKDEMWPGRKKLFVCLSRRRRGQRDSDEAGKGTPRQAREKVLGGGKGNLLGELKAYWIHQTTVYQERKYLRMNILSIVCNEVMMYRLPYLMFFFGKCNEWKSLL